MAAKSTWKPHEVHGELSTAEQNDFPDSVFAFPDASHVRNALARFDQVKGVTDEERDLAFENIKEAARHYDVDIQEANWRELGKST